jgi:CRP-like cAMP-binding protein
MPYGPPWVWVEGGMTVDYHHLVPLNGLSEEALAQAIGQAREVHLERWQSLFHRGDSDDHSYYLLQGEIALDAGDDSDPLVIRAGSEAARHPLARLKPRLYTGVARADCQLACFSDSALEGLVTRDQATAYEVTEFEGDDPGWMYDLLRNPAFSRVPPGNLHTLFSRFEPLPVKAGQMVIHQGDVGDFYYLIRQGKAQVSRAAASEQQLKLAILEPGQGFGEEALISGDPRNASVTMLSDGLLMRLSAKDFNEQLKEPLVQQVNATEAATLMREKDAQLIDVRIEDEFRHGTLKGAVNIPLYLLRIKANSLARDRTYILFCQTGKRGGTAAFLLAQRGFDVRVLRGGLASLGKTATS